MARNPRLQWTWWLLAFAMLLAWRYWPQDPSSQQPIPVASSPASNTVPASNEVSPSAPKQVVPTSRLPDFLPAEAADTIARIQRGGPFRYRQDGSVFGNRERHLPRQPRGWYHEYTVDTPGLSHRGARRIITGGNPPKTWHYTSDHYDSFRDFNPGTASGIAP